MILTTPHPLTPCLGFHPYSLKADPFRTLDGSDKQFFFAGSDDHSCGTPPHIHAGPSSVLPHSHGNSSILLSLAIARLPEGHNSKESQLHFPFYICFPALCGNPSYILGHTAYSCIAFPAFKKEMCPSGLISRSPVRAETLGGVLSSHTSLVITPVGILYNGESPYSKSC